MLAKSPDLFLRGEEHVVAGVSDHAHLPCVQVEQVVVAHDHVAREVVGKQQAVCLEEVVLNVVHGFDAQAHALAQGLHRGAVPGLQVVLLRTAYEERGKGAVVHQVLAGGQGHQVLIGHDVDQLHRQAQVVHDGLVDRFVLGAEVDGVLRGLASAHHFLEQVQGGIGDALSVEGLEEHRLGVDRVLFHIAGVHELLARRRVQVLLLELLDALEHKPSLPSACRKRKNT